MLVDIHVPAVHNGKDRIFFISSYTRYLFDNLFSHERGWILILQCNCILFVVYKVPGGIILLLGALARKHV